MTNHLYVPHTKIAIKKDPRWDQLKQDIYRTWEAIAPDAYDMCDDNNEIAVEMCIDADRLATYGHPNTGKESQAFLTDIMRLLQYPIGLSFLSKEVSLI